MSAPERRDAVAQSWRHLPHGQPGAPIIGRCVLPQLGSFPDPQQGWGAEKRLPPRPAQTEGLGGNPLEGRVRAPTEGLVAPFRLRVGEAKPDPGVGSGPPDPLPRVSLPPHEIEAVFLRRRGRPRAGLRRGPSQGRSGRPKVSDSGVGHAIQLELRPCRRHGPPARARSEPPVRLVDCDPGILRCSLRHVPGGTSRPLHSSGNLRTRLLRCVRSTMGPGGANGRRVDRPRLVPGQVARTRSGAGDRRSGSPRRELPENRPRFP